MFAGVCTCDEGGSLVEVTNGRPYLFGILSKTYGCGRFESPAVFNRVYQYRDWINRNIGFCCFKNDPTFFLVVLRCFENNTVSKTK